MSKIIINFALELDNNSISISHKLTHNFKITSELRPECKF